MPHPEDDYFQRDERDERDDRDSEYDREMNELEEDELANRVDYLGDDREDDYDTYTPPYRSSRDLTPRSTSSVPPRRTSGAGSANSPDFDKFDASAYVRNRRAASGEPPLPSERNRYGPARRRGYSRSQQGEEDLPIGALGEEDVPIGAVGGLGRFLSPETMPILGGFAEELGPLFRWVVYGIGCVLIFALIGCGVVAYTIWSAFRH